MDAVGLIQFVRSRDSLEQERHEGYAISLRQRRIHLVKRDDVVAPVVRGRLHAAENDFDVTGLGTLDDSSKILLKLVHGEAAQAIVAAERHNQDTHVALERPIEARETA